MSYTYVQASGAFGRATGSEAMVNTGPIPRGLYEISEPFDSETHGPVCFHLTPKAGTETYSRGGFLIHGDAIQHPGSASHGCIILPRSVRVGIAMSGDRDLEVV